MSTHVRSSMCYTQHFPKLSYLYTPISLSNPGCQFPSVGEDVRAVLTAASAESIVGT